MLFGANHAPAKTFFKMAVLVLLHLAVAEVAFAANPPVPPQLVPYMQYEVAGSPTGVAISGFGGDNGPAIAAYMSGLQDLAVDSAGNIYFPDIQASVIREINASTGTITTVGGTAPTSCTGTTCAAVHSGCSDGVPALGANLGTGIDGIAIDGYGNVFFVDRGTNTASVIYRGGAQVAAFIALVNPAGVTASGGTVQTGYLYHIVGNINLTTCASTNANPNGTPAVPYGDNGPAFSSTTTSPAFNGSGLQSIHLDGAGILYLQDQGAGLVRVVNTQSVPQTIFGKTIQPGYITSILPCNGSTTATSLTLPCQVQPPSGVTVASFGEGGPAGGFYYPGFGASTNDGDEMDVDAYGNIYVLNGSESNSGNIISAAIAYAGGTATANLIANANSTNSIVGMSSLTVTPGDMYLVLENITLRPASLSVDRFGNIYYIDHNHHSLSRLDVNAPPLLSNLLANSTFNDLNSRGGTEGVPGSPVFCYPSAGNQAASNPILTGYVTSNNFGDGCPGPLGNEFATASGTAVPDGLGNLWAANESSFAIEEYSLSNQFPATPVGRAFNPTTLLGQQTIEVHFDQTNLPATIAQVQGTTNFTTAAATTFAIAPGSIPDFTINPISTTFTDSKGNSYVQFPFGYTGGSQSTGLSTITPAVSGVINPGVTSPPICKTGNSTQDSSLDCMVNIIFTPTAPGLRQSQLVITTANGMVYRAALSGFGVGGQLAIDGGAQQTIFTSTATSAPSVPAVAVGPTGTVYIADPANNQVVVQPVGGAQTTIGTGLKGPMGIAVDTAGNVYIADTGNNRIVEVATATTGAQTVLGGVLAVGTPAYAAWPIGPQYSFNAPQGIAVDAFQNVFVADTGNRRIVEIPSDTHLGPATPLFQYPGAPTFVNPVAVAVDGKNNLYIADTGNATGQIVKVPPGGGDLQNIPTALNVPAASVGNSLTKPNGLAVDGAGNVYVSDSGTNLVYEAPSGTGPAASEFALTSFTGLKAPAGIAVDQNGNLYVADSGNGRVLFDNRQNVVVQFGTQPQNQPATAATLTVTNLGTTPVTLASPFTSVTGTANPMFTFPSSSGSTACANASPLAAGTACTFTVSFLPTSDGVQTEAVSVNGGTQKVTLTGIGEQPLAKLVLSNTPSTGTGVAGTAITVTATLTQPNIAGDTPSGAVNFSYTVDGGAPTVVTPVPMATGSGGTSTASFTIPASAVLQGRLYVVSATYQGDTLDSPTVATPVSIYVPGVPVTATSTSATFVYGSPVPTVTGTVTGITDPSVTYKFVTAASATTPIGVYPITVVFSGGTALNYGFPTVLTSSGAPATVTETAAALTVTANNATTVYGNPPLTYSSVITGAQNGDKFAEEYSPANSALQKVGTYPLVPTVEGANIGNYTVKVTNGTLTVTQAATTITVATPKTTAPACSALILSGCNAILASTVTGTAGLFTITASTLGIGTPTGTVTITETFTPITATAPGTGTPTQSTIGPLTLVNGATQYTLTSSALGTYGLTFAYSGDTNFQASTTASAPTILTVDNADFTISQVTVSSSGTLVPSAAPVQIVPGVIPGGNSAVTGEQAAYPEQATIAIGPVLGMSGTVVLSCTPQNPSYVFCSISPPAITLTSSSTTDVTATISVQTPASLPIGFNFGALLLPLGGILVLGSRRRRKLGNAFWLLIGITALCAGVSACGGGNSVTFYTPIPNGVQYVTVTATGTSPTTSTVIARSFQLPIAIQ